MRFLVLLVNLVPYHLARWGAVAQQGHEVTVLQRRTGDCFKVLETNPTAAPFAVHTLQEPGPSVPALRRQVALWIETVAPEVVVVSGYSFAESLAASQPPPIGVCRWCSALKATAMTGCGSPWVNG